MRYTASNPTALTLPDGEYPFVVTAAEEKTSSNGNEMIALTLKIKDGPSVYDNLVNVESAWFKIDQFRAAIGDQIAPGTELDLNPDKWIRRVGRCILYTDMYDGKRRNKVAEYVVPLRNQTKPVPAAPVPVPPAPKATTSPAPANEFV
jgi:Protein of unknown function (DUF669)